MKRWLLILALSMLLWAAPSLPFPQHVEYQDGSIKPSNFTQEEMDNDVRHFYDIWKRRYLKRAKKDSSGHSLYRIAMGRDSNVTVSEGQGYGMVIMALMAGYDPKAQHYFDSLWYFSRKYPSEINPHLMSWKIENSHPVEGADSAFDGDADIAYALLMADRQWGSEGRINYRQEARRVIRAIQRSTIGRRSRLPMLGDWVESDGERYNQYTSRSSDFMLSHFRSFANATGEGIWYRVVQRSQQAMFAIQKHYSSHTGLLPDFLVGCTSPQKCRPAPKNFLEGPHDGDYYYNAGRDPWRIGVDYLLFGSPASRRIVTKMMDWLDEKTDGRAGRIKAGYTLVGKSIGNYRSSFFQAPFGVAAMSRPRYQELLDSIYNAVRKRHEGYYEESVTLLSLLIMSGNYWQPQYEENPACNDGIDNDGDGRVDFPLDRECTSIDDETE